MSNVQSAVALTAALTDSEIRRQGVAAIKDCVSEERANIDKFKVFCELNDRVFRERRHSPPSLFLSIMDEALPDKDTRTRFGLQVLELAREKNPEPYAFALLAFMHSIPGRYGLEISYQSIEKNYRLALQHSAGSGKPVEALSSYALAATIARRDGNSVDAECEAIKLFSAADKAGHVIAHEVMIDLHRFSWERTLQESFFSAVARVRKAEESRGSSSAVDALLEERASKGGLLSRCFGWRS